AAETSDEAQPGLSCWPAHNTPPAPGAWADTPDLPSALCPTNAGLPCVANSQEAHTHFVTQGGIMGLHHDAMDEIAHAFQLRLDRIDLGQVVLGLLLLAQPFQTEAEVVGDLEIVRVLGYRLAQQFFRRVPIPGFQRQQASFTSGPRLSRS